MKNNQVFYFFLRLPIAASLLGHGLVRLPKLGMFSEWMLKEMEKSIIPQLLILPFSYLLPIIEALLGLLLLIGFKTKYTIYASLGLMSILILGSSSIENWGAVQPQLLHSLYLFALLCIIEKVSFKINSTI